MQSPGLIVVAALLLLTPLAYGQLVQNIINVGARFCCASSGNCANGTVPIPGVRADLNCNTTFGNALTLARGVTDNNGVVNLGLSNILGPLVQLIGRILPCRVVVNLPLNNTVCPLLSRVNGILSGVPRLVNTAVDPVLGVVRNLTVPLFVNVTVG